MAISISSSMSCSWSGSNFSERLPNRARSYSFTSNSRRSTVSRLAASSLST